MNSENLPELIKRFPMGSKVVINGGVDYCAKVVGYHELGGYVLVYNPSLVGHSGGWSAYNDWFLPISSAHLQNKYGNHLLYFPEDSIKLVQKSAFAILKQELGYE